MHGIEARMMLPEVRQLLGREQGEVRIGQRLAEALQRGRGHDGVAEPVDAADEDAARLGRRMADGRHRACARSPTRHPRCRRTAPRAGPADGGLRTAGFEWLPAVVHPEPVGRVAADGGFEGAVDVAHDGGGGAGPAILAGGDFGARFDAPAGQADAVADAGEQRAVVAQREDGGRGRGGAVVPEERPAQRACPTGRPADPA